MIPHNLLIRRLAKSLGLKQREVRAVLAAYFGAAAEAVKYEGRFSAPRVGVWTATTRKARTLRNPVTKQLMRVSATYGVRFRPAKRGPFTRASLVVDAEAKAAKAKAGA